MEREATGRPAIRGLFGIIPAQLSAWFFLGAWFLYQLIEPNFGMFSTRANGSGVAFFAHVGGFLFGLTVTQWLYRGRRAPARPRARPYPEMRSLNLADTAVHPPDAVPHREWL